MSSISILVSGILVLSIVRILYGLFRRRVIDKLPGPPPTSWLTGNLPAMYRADEITDPHFEWTEKYGSVLRLHEEFNRKTLFLSDPKALQYILNTSGYNFHKTGARRSHLMMLLGKGLVWSDGAQHTRQRRIMIPAFSFNALRHFIPMFTYKAQLTVNKIKEEIELTKEANPNVVNIVPWLSRLTLDVIGTAAAAYEFEAIEGGQSNRLAKIYGDLSVSAFFKRPDIDLVISYVMGNVPGFFQKVLRRLPTKSSKRLRPYLSAVTAVAQEVVDQQTALYVDGKEGSKDLMSVLVKANLSEDPKTKITNEEVLSQLTTFFFAGHETTAFTISWALYELARHPEYQNKVREEIKATQTRLAERADRELTISDLDSMRYLPALMKETLRLYPIVSGIFREASQDEIVPLSHPVTLTTGETITSLPVERGRQVFMSFIAYNRHKSVWGEDADVWRPERFLEDGQKKQQINLGVMNNLITFGSGVRNCIGWRFAVLEMQAVLFELLENFEFSPPPGNVEILRVHVGVMEPMVKGSKTGQIELPLTVTPLRA